MIRIQVLIAPCIDYCRCFLTGLSVIIFSYLQFILHTDDILHFLKQKHLAFQQGNLNSLLGIQESTQFVTTLLFMACSPLSYLVCVMP